MKENKKLIYKIEANDSVRKLAESQYEEFISSGGKIEEGHTYERHSKLDPFRLGAIPVVSWFVSNDKHAVGERIRGIIKVACKSAKIGLLNFAVTRNSGEMIIVRSFKEPIGYVQNPSGRYLTKKVTIVVSKATDGHLYVKTAYPVL